MCSYILSSLLPTPLKGFSSFFFLGIHEPPSQHYHSSTTLLPYSHTIHTIARNKMSQDLFHIQPHVSSCIITRDMYIPTAAHRKVETGPPLFSWTIPVRASM